jgi:hypothetical protein
VFCLIVLWMSYDEQPSDATPNNEPPTSDSDGHGLDDTTIDNVNKGAQPLALQALRAHRAPNTLTAKD